MMQTGSFFKTSYASPLGPITLFSDGEALTGLYFEGQKYYPLSLLQDAKEAASLPVLQEGTRWLDLYFEGKHVSPSDISLAPAGSEFQLLIWQLLCAIPYGSTVTYGQLAKKVADLLGKNTVAPQAVGGAVGRNPISLIIPCHRVLGADGSLTGYAGGIEKKAYLLALEQKNAFDFSADRV